MKKCECSGKQGPKHTVHQRCYQYDDMEDLELGPETDEDNHCGGSPNHEQENDDP